MSTRQADEKQHWPSRGRGPSALVWRAYDTPWGEGMVAADQDGLRLVELPKVPAGPATSCDQYVMEDGGSGSSPRRCTALENWAEALEEYFRGERLAWAAEDIPWDDLGVRPFEREVYEALLSVPPGETVSYGQLAEMAGHPRAARAVGSAMAANPIPVVIPCHRVIRADGTLGNYGDDPDWKPRLLEHERSTLKTRTSN
jgi:methylated-DNA-[protein]-cysteine S-methyltransferase